MSYASSNSGCVARAAALLVMAIGVVSVQAETPDGLSTSDLQRGPIPVPVTVGALFEAGTPGGGTGGPEGSCPETVVTHTQTPFAVGSSVNAQGGFIQTEWAAAEYVIPTSEFPIRLELAEILFAAQQITANSHTEWSVGVWQGNPRTGSQVALYSSDDVILPHLQHPIGTNVAAIIQFSVEPGQGGDIIIEAANPGNPTNSFSVGFRVDRHNNQLPGCLGTCPVACDPNGFPPFCPPNCSGNNMMPTTDIDPTPEQNTLNWIWGSSCTGACFTGWKMFSEIQTECRPTGDWMIRATYTSAACGNEPEITGVQPSSAINAGPVHLTVSGQNMGGGFPAAQLTRVGEAPIVGTNITVNPGGTSLEGDFNITGAAPGFWTMEVATVDGTGTLDNAFEITLPQPPQVFSFFPNNANNNEVVAATVTGDHFINGQTTVSVQNGPTVVNATNVVVHSENSVTCDLDMRCKPVGSYSCTVATPYGNATIGSALAIGALLAPTVFAADISFTSNCPGSLTLNVFGLDFQLGASAALVRSGHPDVPGTNVLVNDPTSITATFNTALLSTGSYNLRVTNPDCQFADSDPQIWSLSVSGCVPSISSITPSTSNNHQTAVSITNLAGGNFVSPATVRFTRSGQPDIVATNVVVVNPTRITCTMNPYLVQTGAWNVVVTNPGGASATLPNGFNITPGPVPTVSSVISNNSGPSDNCDPWNARILGANFLSSPLPTAKLVLTGQPDIIGTNLVWVSSSQMTVTFDLTGAATTPTADKWDCVVTNPDGQSGTGLDKVDVTQCAVACLKADVNNDGQRDGLDVTHFVGVLLSQTGTPTELCACDLAAPNGVIDNADIAPFVECLVNAVCP